MMQKDRIKLEMNGMETLMAMSNGNVGALRVCVDLLKMGEQYDPDSMFGGFGTLLHLDSQRIYEDRIWMLYKDVCDQDYGKMIAMVRACQLGLLPSAVLHHAIENRGDGLNVDETVALVQKALPNFRVDGSAMPAARDSDLVVRGVTNVPA